MLVVGVPKELKDHEHRVAITPDGVAELVHAGHRVVVEQRAGIGSSITDDDFVGAGAIIVETAEDVWGDSDLVLKVKEPVPDEFSRLRAGQTLFTYLHLAASRDVTDALCASGATAIAYEMVESADHRLPLLAPMSEVAGRMATQVGAHLLEREQGGRGVLMGGVAGVAPANVVILGAGMAGQNAAAIAQGMGAHVTVLDTNIDKLRALDATHNGRVRTLASNRRSIEELVLTADIVIGSVLVIGARAPKLITAEMIRRMRTGAVVIDIAIDQGGCFETSRMTTHSDPIYVIDGVVHYCVGNMPGAVPHTSTYALTNVTLPYVMRLANLGTATAVAADPSLARGVNVWKGRLASQVVAAAHGMEWAPLEL